MKRTLLCLMIIASSLIGQTQSVDKLVREARELIDNKKCTKAFDVVAKLWAMDSNRYDVNIVRGEVYQCLKAWEKSYEGYSNAIQKFPDSVEAYHRRAILLYTLRYTDDAIEDNTRALALSHNDTLRLMSYVNRGNCYQQKRAFQKAFEDYTEAYALDSTNIGTINNLATVLDELGKEEEAVMYLQKLLKLDPNFIGTYVNLGFQYSKMERYQEAIKYFDKALTIEKDEPLALNNRGYAKYKVKDFSGAIDDINKSIKLYPANSYAYRNRALVFLALKENKKACMDIDEAIRLGFREQYGDEIVDLSKKNCADQ